MNISRWKHTGKQHERDRYKGLRAEGIVYDVGVYLQRVCCAIHVHHHRFRFVVRRIIELRIAAHRSVFGLAPIAIAIAIAPHIRHSTQIQRHHHDDAQRQPAPRHSAEVHHKYLGLVRLDSLELVARYDFGGGRLVGIVAVVGERNVPSRLGVLGLAGAARRERWIADNEIIPRPLALPALEIARASNIGVLAVALALAALLTQIVNEAGFRSARHGVATERCVAALDRLPRAESYPAHSDTITVLHRPAVAERVRTDAMRTGP